MRASWIRKSLLGVRPSPRCAIVPRLERLEDRLAPATIVWNQTAAGSYTYATGSNWVGGVAPGTNDVASFTNNIAGNQTINVAAPVSLQGIVLGDSDNTHAFALTGSTITLNTAAGVVKNAGTGSTNTTADTIGNALTLSANSTVLSNAYANANLALNGAIGGAFSVSKMGSGGVVLGANNSYSAGTTISAGTLQVGSGGTTGSLGIGAVVDNAALIYNLTSFTVNNALSGTGTISNTGATGALTFSSSIAMTGSGGFAFTTSGTGTVIGTGANFSVVNGTGSITDTSSATSGTGITINGTSNSLSATGSGSITISGQTASTGGGFSGLLLHGVNLTTAGTINLNGQNATEWGINFDASATIHATSGTTTLTGTATAAGAQVKSPFLFISNPTITLTADAGAFIALTGGAATGANEAVFCDYSTGTTFNVTGNVSFTAGATASGDAFWGTNGAINAGAPNFVVGANTALTLDAGALTVTSGLGVSSMGANSSVTLIGGTGTISGAFVLTNSTSTLNVNATGVPTLSGIVSGAGKLNKTGAGTLILSGSNSYSGGTTVQLGTLQFGTGSANGVLPSTDALMVNSGATLRIANNTVTTALPWNRFAGSGTLSLFATLGTYASDVANHAQWNDAFLSSSFSGKLRIESGRVVSNFTSDLGNATAVEVLGGGQLLTFDGTYPAIATTISGTGYGEPNFPGALRIAQSVVGVWPGNIALAANASVYAQDNAVWTLTGNISGPYQLDFTVGSATAGGFLVVAPASGANTYGSTKITAGHGYVSAGNANAFSTGGLTMTSGTLYLNGKNLSFANLSGGGFIINGDSSTAATLTVGSDNSNSTFTGRLDNGNSAALGFTKVGNGTLTISANHAGTGMLTVSGGVLAATGSWAGPLSATSGGTVAPGGVGGIGSFSTGAATFASGSTLHVNITGNVPGTSHDLLNVTGAVNVTGATLTSVGTWNGSVGDRAAFIVNDSSDPVVGTFASEPEGTFRFFSGSPDYAQLTYASTGNDVAWIVNTRPTMLSGEPITRASATSANIEANSYSAQSAISADGRYVVFVSYATNLADGLTHNVANVFRKDLQSGAIVLVSADSGGLEANGDCSQPAVSSDGRYVVFASYASNLAAGANNGRSQIYRKDLYAGAANGPILVSADSSATQGNGDSSSPAISVDGAYVAFSSYATNLVAGANNGYAQIYRKYAAFGTFGSIVLASASSSGTPANNPAAAPALSSDGRYVAFQSAATNLTVGGNNFIGQIYRKDLNSGVSGPILLASSDGSGTQGNSASLNPLISSNGDYVVFQTFATNLASGATNGNSQVLLKSLSGGGTLLVSCDAAGTQGNASSYAPTMSSDGHFVAFQSYATNFVAGIGNGSLQVFRKDVFTGLLAAVSVGATGAEGTLDSSGPAISADGSYVVFDSYSPGLAPGDSNFTSDVLVWGMAAIVENTATVATFIATDPDVPRQTISYSLFGNDANRFTINSSGVLSFLSPPDFENPTDAGGNNVYDLTVYAADGVSYTESRDFTVNVWNATATQSTVYVNGDWSGYTNGTAIGDANPNQSGSQPATFGISAFASLQGAAETTDADATITLFPGTAGTYSQNAVFSNPFTLNVPTGSVTLSGILSGPGGFTKIGNGAVILTNTNNSYQGGTTIVRGKLQVAGDGALGLAGTQVTADSPAELIFAGGGTSSRIFDMNDATLTVNTGVTLTLSNAEIDGGFLKGPGAIATTSAGASIFNGATVRSSLTVNANGTDSFVNVSNAGAVSSASGKTISLDGFTHEIGGNLTVNGTANVADFFSYGNLTVNGTMTNVGSSELAFGGGSVTTINAGKTLNIGTMDALVSGGIVSNYGDFGSATRTVFVDFGGKVIGPGTFHTVSTQNGGVYSPGNSPGPATMDLFPINGGGTFNFEISNAAGTAGTVNGWDMATIAPTIYSPSSAQLVLTATASTPYVILIESRTNDGVGQTAGATANFNPSQNYAWKFLDGSHVATTVTGTFDPAAFTIVTSGFQNAFTGTFSIELRDSGKNFYVVYTAPVPAPTVASVAPFIGPTSGGNTVIITGTNFAAIDPGHLASAVKFGAANAVSYTVNSASQITAVAPVASPSTVNVVVTNPGGSSSTVGAVDNYTFATPSITSVVINGGTSIPTNIYGTSINIAGQQSIVEQIAVTFNQRVLLDSNMDGTSQAFNITSLAGSMTASVAIPSTAHVAVNTTPVLSTGNGTDGYTQYILTFAAGAGVNSRNNAIPNLGNTFTTLTDGLYQLNTTGAHVHSGVSDTTADRTDKFWALYGAVNDQDVTVSSPLTLGGNKLLVDGIALGEMYQTFGSFANVAGPPAYNVAYDSNLDGIVDGIDLGKMYANFGTQWLF